VAVLSDDIIAGAQELANLVGADWISPATWLRWLNQSIVALFQKIVVWNPDFFLSHVDFSSDGTANNPFAPPADFGVARGITKDPSVLRQRRSLRSYNFADRDRQRELAYRVDGGLIYLESATAFNVNLRLWYDAKPITLVQAPTPDVIVRAASAADLSVANPSQLWLPAARRRRQHRPERPVRGYHPDPPRRGGHDAFDLRQGAFDVSVARHGCLLP
jgi:hypothetical protein